MAMDKERGSTATPESDGRSAGVSISGMLIAFLVVVGLIVAALVAWAALTDDGGGDEGLNVGVTASDIHSDPEEYYGASVMVSGEVNEVIGPNAFTIGGEGFLGGDELLIVSAEGIPAPEGSDRPAGEALAEGDIVQVTGTVSEFARTDVENDTGLSLDDAAFDNYDGEPSIVAESINLTPRLSDLPAGAITIEQINENEDLFDGLEVTVNGEAGGLWGPGAFMLQESVEEESAVTVAGDERILIVGAPDVIPSEIIEGAATDVTGVVRLIDEDGEERSIEEEFGISVEDGLLDAWQDEPVIIASSVTTGPAEATLPLESLMTNALGYVGTQITTGGVVDEVVHPQAVRLTTEDQDAIVQTEVLVVGGQDVFGETIVDEAFVQVTGTPYLFDSEFEAEYGDQFGFLWEDDAFDLDESSIVIVADSMQVVR